MADKLTTEEIRTAIAKIDKEFRVIAIRMTCRTRANFEVVPGVFTILNTLDGIPVLGNNGFPYDNDFSLEVVKTYCKLNRQPNED